MKKILLPLSFIIALVSCRKESDMLKQPVSGSDTSSTSPFPEPDSTKRDSSSVLRISTLLNKYLGVKDNEKPQKKVHDSTTHIQQIDKELLQGLNDSGEHPVHRRKLNIISNIFYSPSKDDSSQLIAVTALSKDATTIDTFLVKKDLLEDRKNLLGKARVNVSDLGQPRFKGCITEIRKACSKTHTAAK